MSGLTPGQVSTARIAVWLLQGIADGAGEWLRATPAELAEGAGVPEQVAREQVALLVARGFVALEKREGAFRLAPTASGIGPLRAYALAFASHSLRV